MSELDRTDRAIAETRAELKSFDSEAFKGCWIDSTQGRKGDRIYHRLRWFKSDGSKGCKTLRPDEIGKAQRAIELWSHLDTLEREREVLQGKVNQLRAIATELGYELHVKHGESGYELALLDIVGTPIVNV